MTKFSLATLALIATTAASPLIAQSWTLNGDASRIAFGSIKKDTVGEVHEFTSLSGAVTSDGMASIEIDLASVETYIDIRNERMREFVFAAAPSASFSTQLDMAGLNALATGGTATQTVKGTLDFLGNAVDVEADLFVARLSETSVMVTTDSLLMLSTADLGIDGGVDKLQELADLPSITRVTPVTLRLVFDAGSETAAAAPETTVATAAPAAMAGDPAAGEKVFRKCKACHVADAEKNRAGPHLVGIIGRPIAQVEGFKYSSAFQEQDLIWNTETLTAYLTDPKSYIPGNKMAFRGLRKAEDIDNVLAYFADLAK